MNTMLLVPVGGLANRMRAIASAVVLMNRVGGNVKIVWLKDRALNASFGELFEPPCIEGISVEESSFRSLLLYDRPRKRNLYIPGMFQKCLFRSCLYEREVAPLCYQTEQLEKWALQGKVYMASYDQFMNYPEALVKSLFRPVESIRKIVEQRSSCFSAYTVGVHIRRTDHAAAIRQSPLELFYDCLDKESDLHDNLCIFLATDSEDVKRQMRKRYGNRVITADTEADRNSVEGMRNGVADMYTLAHTVRIYGSFQSSFSELASQLGSVPLLVVRA